MSKESRLGDRALTVVLLGAAAAGSGCASVAPNAENVRLTRKSEDVAGCKEMGYIQSWLAFSFRDAEVQLRNKAVAAGGNTVLVTSPFGETTGTAYQCGEKKP